MLKSTLNKGGVFQGRAQIWRILSRFGRFWAACGAFRLCTVPKTSFFSRACGAQPSSSSPLYTPPKTQNFRRLRRPILIEMPLYSSEKLEFLRAVGAKISVFDIEILGKFTVHPRKVKKIGRRRRPEPKSQISRSEILLKSPPTKSATRIVQKGVLDKSRKQDF